MIIIYFKLFTYNFSLFEARLEMEKNYLVLMPLLCAKLETFSGVWSLQTSPELWRLPEVQEKPRIHREGRQGGGLPEDLQVFRVINVKNHKIFFSIPGLQKNIVPPTNHQTFHQSPNLQPITKPPTNHPPQRRQAHLHEQLLPGSHEGTGLGLTACMSDWSQAAELT